MSCKEWSMIKREHRHRPRTLLSFDVRPMLSDSMNANPLVVKRNGKKTTAKKQIKINRQKDERQEKA
jgi:hypothetical protein